jgi:hypothetical protein
VRLFNLLVCKKYNEEVYDPLVVGAKFIDKSDVQKYKNSKKAKKLQKYKTEEEFLFGIEANGDSIASSINDDEVPMPANNQTRKSSATSLARIRPDEAPEIGKRDGTQVQAKDPKQKKEGLAPLFLFLTSALNVEMVYVILQGISQFALLNFVKDGMTVDQLKRFQKMEYVVKKDGDITVILRQIEIKNADKWGKTSGQDLMSEVGSAKTLEEGRTQINNTKVQITYYRLYEFAKLFGMNRLSMQLLEKSLAPELNRKQVFNAGEGAGKSGSFFFFSHDRKYIIKTMTGAEIEVMLKILPNYIEHLRKTPNSLIAKIFGIFTIEKDGFGKVHVMLMENTL